MLKFFDRGCFCQQITDVGSKSCSRPHNLQAVVCSKCLFFYSSNLSRDARIRIALVQDSTWSLYKKLFNPGLMHPLQHWMMCALESMYCGLILNGKGTFFLTISSLVDFHRNVNHMWSCSTSFTIAQGQLGVIIWGGQHVQFVSNTFDHWSYNSFLSVSSAGLQSLR